MLLYCAKQIIAVICEYCISLSFSRVLMSHRFMLWWFRWLYSYIDWCWNGLCFGCCDSQQLHNSTVTSWTTKRWKTAPTNNK